MKFFAVFLVALVLSGCVLAASNSNSTASGLGDGIWRTFSYAFFGRAPAMPVTVSEAESMGWVQAAGASCDSNLGIQWTQNGDTVTESTPVSMYFTAGGQLAGMGVNVYGSGAAPSNLVDLGFWIPINETEWYLTVTFRAPGDICNSSDQYDEMIGDQVVINQGSLDFNVPVTAMEAECKLWTPGSCMYTMGQHWFYDLEDAPNQSWDDGNLVPIVAMYYPPDSTGTLNAFFFTSPTQQPGGMPGYSPGDWEGAITASQMCLNWCDDSCQWNTDYWSTMHIYFHSNYTSVGCPGGHGPLQRTCPTTFMCDM